MVTFAVQFSHGEPAAVRFAVATKSFEERQKDDETALSP
jgi:hypothetical protein